MPLPPSVAKAFKSLNVKPEASQMGGGLELEIVGHWARPEKGIPNINK
jgi:hypothetical protein